MTSVELLALAAIEEGKYAQGFPSFGPERRGAPVAAFNRVDDRQIKNRSGIYHPDVVIVLDEGLVGLVNVADGLKADGILIISTSKTRAEVEKALNHKCRLGIVHGLAIARQELGVTIVNTTMLMPSRKQPRMMKKMDSAKMSCALLKPSDAIHSARWRGRPM